MIKKCINCNEFGMIGEVGDFGFNLNKYINIWSWVWK